MITFGKKEYSGSIVSVTEDKIVAVINTVDTLQDVCAALDGITEITETVQDGTQKTYAITSANAVFANTRTVYTIELLTKPTYLQELSKAVDALLVMVLEKKDV